MDKLSQDHTFLLRLLEHGKMDAQTLATATFSTTSQVQRIADDLVDKGLLDKEWNSSKYYYYRRK
ncbi:MAG: helix-turn-helix domain-containing protein [Candidatus Hydrothermarchaeales archaeon]